MTKGKLPTREQSQRIHFKRRLEERYGITCNRNIYRFLLNQVHGGDARFLKKQSNAKIIYEVYFCGDPIWVAYDKERREFRTALVLGCKLREVDYNGRTIPIYD